MDSIHKNFNVLKALSKKLNKRIAYISEDTPDRSKLYGWLPFSALRQICYQVIKSIDMAWALTKAGNVDLVLIFEHKPWFSYILYIVCIIKRKPVFFIVHGIQQTCNNTFFHKLGFHTILFIEKHFAFWPIHIEVSDKEVTGIKKFTKSIVIPHPLPKQKSTTTKPVPTIISIGILGMIRPDKPIQPIIDIMRMFQGHDDIQVVIGTAGFSLPDGLLKNNSFPIHDTTSSADYINFIKSQHIIVNNFEKEQFYFRPSGIINDSLSGSCFVISPNFPVFSAQINIPVRVGSTYNNIAEIPILIKDAIAEIRQQGMQHRFDEWIDYRSPTKIITIIAEQISRELKYQH